MKNRIFAFLLSILFSIQTLGLGGSHDEFFVDIPFPKTRTCGEIPSPRFPDLSKEGYCPVGSTVIVNKDIEALNRGGTYYVVFYFNPKATDSKVAFFVEAKDGNIKSQMVAEAPADKGGEFVSFNSNINIPSQGTSNFKDFMDSSQGQALMGGIAQGFVQAFRYAQSSQFVQEFEQKQFESSGQVQIQISIQVQKNLEETQANLADMALGFLTQSKGLAIGGQDSVFLDPTLTANYANDSISAFLDRDYRSFLQLQSMISSSGSDINLNTRSSYFRTDGSSRFFSANRSQDASSKSFIKSSNALALNLHSSALKATRHQKAWVQAQKLYHLAGVINRSRGNFVRANEDFDISAELAKMSLNVSDSVKLGIDSDSGRLVKKESGDLKAGFFNSKLQKAAFNSAYDSIVENKTSLKGGLIEGSRETLEKFRAINDHIKKLMPGVHDKWTSFVKASNKLMELAQIELSAGNVELALQLGELSLNALDALSYVTPIGTAEAIVNFGERPSNWRRSYKCRNSS